jgi:hypothetical protein
MDKCYLNILGRARLIPRTLKINKASCFQVLIHITCTIRQQLINPLLMEDRIIISIRLINRPHRSEAVVNQLII